MVDDEPVTRDVISRYLRMDGHEVVAVTDAVQALTHLETETLDLLITDHGMPGMSGLELQRELQAQGRADHGVGVRPVPARRRRVRRRCHHDVQVHG